MKSLKKSYNVSALVFTAALAILASACSTPKSAYHTRYTAVQCKKPIGREDFAQSLMEERFLKKSEAKGIVDLFKRPKIEKLSFLSPEPYQDSSGEIGVAVCSGGDKTYILAEEMDGCLQKNCTKEDQHDLKRIVQKYQCEHIEAASSRSLSWEIYYRQDWTRESCRSIAENLKF